MQVIILAAGSGKRLYPLTETTPKCLVEVHGKPIIFNALDALVAAGIERIVIVTGHLAEQVKGRIGGDWKGVPVVYVHNPDYAKTNNIYSLWLARGHMDRDSVLMECDLFFDPELIARLLEGDWDSVALVDPFKPFMDGTVVAVNERGMISRMVLPKDQKQPFDYADKFKTVNIYRFSRSFLSDVFVPNLDLYVKTLKHDQYYELLLTVLIYMGYDKLKAVSLQGIRWMEIDDFQDLERAEILFADPDRLYQRINAIHGGYWRYEFKDFAYLYNLYFPPSELFTELKLNLTMLAGNYPSAQKELAALLSPWVGMAADELAVGNGASELIAIIKRHLVKKLAIPYPTFNEYETHLDREQIHAVDCLNEDHSLDPDRYIRSVKAGGANAALLINPNNPTASFVEPDKVRYLLDHLTSLDLFLLDESFIDFVSTEGGLSLSGDLKRYKNLVIIKSLSKNLGTPGLRLGYAASASPKIMKVIRENIPIWNVNSAAEYLLEILTKYRAEFKDSCRRVIEDRDYFYEKLRALPGIKPYKPHANFVFVKLDPGVASWTLKKRLFERAKLLIKDCSNKTGLGDGSYVRLAVRTKPESDDCVRELSAVLEEMKIGQK